MNLNIHTTILMTKNKIERRMKMKLNYAVIGTFVNSDNDIVLDYFETVGEAQLLVDEVENDDELYPDLEFAHIYKIEKVED